jgi:hypothetical protein
MFLIVESGTPTGEPFQVTGFASDLKMISSALAVIDLGSRSRSIDSADHGGDESVVKAQGYG